MSFRVSFSSRAPHFARHVSKRKYSTPRHDVPEFHWKTLLTWDNLYPLMLLSVFTSITLNTGYFRKRVSAETSRLEEQVESLTRLLQNPDARRGMPGVERELIRVGLDSASDDYEVVPAAGSWTVPQKALEQSTAYTAKTHLSEIFFKRKFKDDSALSPEAEAEHWEKVIGDAVRDGEDPVPNLSPRTRSSTPHISELVKEDARQVDDRKKGVFL